MPKFKVGNNIYEITNAEVDVFKEIYPSGQLIEDEPEQTKAKESVLPAAPAVTTPADQSGKITDTVNQFDVVAHIPFTVLLIIHTACKELENSFQLLVVRRRCVFNRTVTIMNNSDITRDSVLLRYRVTVNFITNGLRQQCKPSRSIGLPISRGQSDSHGFAVSRCPAPVIY